MKYIVGWNNIVDLAVILLAAVGLAIFFVKRKTYKALFLCLAFYGVFVMLSIISALFDAPVAGDIALVFAVIMAMIFMFAYDRNIRTWFYNLINAKDKTEGGDDAVSDDVLKDVVNEIVKACQNLSKSRTGALIVLAPTIIPDAIVETGITLDAQISAELLESLFYPGAPMHDGAVIIRRKTLIAAGCFLPLSQNQVISKALGTRHRAGIGITEETDMITIIVSEETGIISYAEKGEIKRYLTNERLKEILYGVFKIDRGDKKKK